MLNKYTQKHIVDCFFVENCGLAYDSFVDMVSRRWKGPRASPLAHLERSIIEVRAVPAVPLFLALKPASLASWSSAISRRCGITLHGGVDFA